MPVPEDDAIPALPPQRLASVRWQFRTIKVLGLLLVAAWGLLIAAWVALHLLILPHIDRWRAPIERYASELVGQPVRIGMIIVNSNGWLPTLELRDVALLDAQAAPVLQLPRVVGALSAKSIFSLQPRFSQLLIDGADLEVHRDADGRVFVAGFELGGRVSDHRPLSNWLFKQHEVVLRNGVVRWRDALHPAELQRFTEVQWVMRNSLRRHDLRVDATPPAAWGEPVTLLGRFTQPLLAEPADWTRWHGTVHASVPQVDVAALAPHFTLPSGLTQGRGALRAWIEVADGRADAATLDVALRDVTLRPHPEREALVFADMSGRLIGRRDDRGVALEAREFGFATADGLRWPASTAALRWQQSPTGELTGGELSAEHLDLALLAQVAQRLQLGEVAEHWMTELKPRGRVEGLSLRWEGALVAAATAMPQAASAAASSALGWALPPRYALRATVSGLALASAASADPLDIGRPGVRNADLVLSASERGGEVSLAMKQGELDLPGVFAEPLLPLDQLDAALSWRIERPTSPGSPPQVTVKVQQARFANADVQGEFQGNWATGTATAASASRGDPRYPGRLDLEGVLTQADATRVARYLPLGLDAEARHYVEHAVQAGRLAHVNFRVKGDLNDFPFADAHSAGGGEFRIAGQVEDLRFAYVPSLPASAAEPAYTSPWPVLEGLSGELVFDRLSMEIRNAQAHTQGVKLTGVQGGIKRLDERPVLVLEGAGRGGLADLLRFVNASPVGGWIGNALAQSTATGNADLKLTLTVPLADPPATAVRGSVALAASDVRLRPDTPMLSGARGRIDFSQQGFSIVGGAGKLLGGEVNIDGGLQPDGAMRFAAQGTVTADGLRRSSDVGGAVARFAASLSGQAAYRVALNLVNGKPDLLVTSNLVGLASDLPLPLRKAADTPLALRFQTAAVADAATASTSPARDFIRLDLGNLLQAQYVRDVSAASPRVLRGGIGVMEPAQMPSSGVAATLNMASLNLGDWQRLADGLTGLPGAAAGSEASVAASASTGYWPTTLGLRAQEVQLGSRRLNQVVAKVALEGPLWRVNLESEQASGTLEYRPPRAVSNPSISNGTVGAAGSAGRLYARLSRLSLPKEDTADVETLLDQPAQSVPALDIVVDDLVLRGKRLGRLELDAVNRAGAREWRLTRLALTTPEARLTASGNWAAVAGNASQPAGASATPATPATVRRVTLNFKLELSNGGALIERLGFGKVVKGGKGGMSGQIAWDGSPLAMDYPSLTGQVNLSIAAGQFLKADPGVGRLLGVLSLQALPRRFLLDFRDLFQQGFAFDDISGDLQIAAGVAKTNNLRMRGVQAAVLMEGKTDIEQETQDLRVIVVPEIDAGTASLAYAAINPAIGLGAFLAQTLFSKPLIAASTREFHITGSWTEPKVDKVERSFTDAVPDIPAPSVAPAPPIPAAPSASDSEGKP